MPDNQGQVDPNGQPPADGLTGQETKSFNGQTDVFGVKPDPEGAAPPKQQGTQEPQTQQTNTSQTKDERHAAQKITELSEQRYQMASMAVQADPDAIYRIAEMDTDTAQKLIDEFDYGVDTVEELLATQGAEDKEKHVIKEKVKEDKEKEALREEILSEKIKRLQSQDEGLKDESVEAEFRRLYKAKTFPDKTEEELITIAKAVAGKVDTESPDKKVAREMLKNFEGVQHRTSQSQTLKTDPAKEKVKQILLKQGYQEKEIEKYLN